MKKLLAALVALSCTSLMAQESFVQVPPDSIGKKLRMRTSVVGGQTVYHQGMFLVDESGNVLGAANPLAVTFSNSVIAVTQSGSWTVSVSNFPATQPVSGSVSVSNFPATQPVSGTVTSNQGAAAAVTSGWPVIHGSTTSATATWTSATSSGTSISVSCVGMSAALFTQSPTSITGGTILPEISRDSGTTWLSQYAPRADMTTAVEQTFNQGSAQKWVIPCDGATNVRARLNSPLTGAGSEIVTLDATASIGGRATVIGNSLTLTANQLEDSPHVSGHNGIPAWGVRNDVPAVMTSTDLDYSPISTNDRGQVQVVQGTQPAVTTTWTSATPLDTSLSMSTVGYTAAYFSIVNTGSITNGFAIFEVSNDGGTNWFGLSTVYASGPVSGTVSLPAGKQLVMIPVSGMTNVRARLNPVITGTGSVFASLSATAATRPDVWVAVSNAVNLGSVVPGTATNSLGKAEDAGHASGDTGVFALGVRNDADADFTSTDLDYSPVAVDVKGHPKVAYGAIPASTLTITSATALDATVSTSVAGMSMVSLSISPTGTVSSGNISYEISDDGGTTWYAYVMTRMDGTVAISNTAGITIKTFWETAVPASATNFRIRLTPVMTGTGSVAIRLVASASPHTPTAQIYGTASISSIVPGTAGTQLGKSEDAASGGGDVGTMMLGVRNDTDAAQTSTDLDYGAISIDSTGRAKVLVYGTSANNTAITGNPIMQGVEARSTQPTAATDGNIRQQLGSLDGAIYTRNGGPVTFSGGLTAIAATLTQIVAAPAAGLSLYITDVVIGSNTATGGSFLLRYGTGSNCVTGTTTIFPNIAAQTTGVMPYPPNTQAPSVMQFGTPIKVPAANALCIICVATNTCVTNVSGFTAP
jgi:hypothetical protein